jgi:predicted metal-binding protein
MFPRIWNSLDVFFDALFCSQMFMTYGLHFTVLSPVKVSNAIFHFLKVYFGMLDGLLAAEQLPEEYRDRCQVSHCQ